MTQITDFNEIEIAAFARRHRFTVEEAKLAVNDILEMTAEGKFESRDESHIIQRFARQGA